MMSVAKRDVGTQLRDYHPATAELRHVVAEKGGEPLASSLAGPVTECRDYAAWLPADFGNGEPGGQDNGGRRLAL